MNRGFVKKQKVLTKENVTDVGEREGKQIALFIVKKGFKGG